MSCRRWVNSIEFLVAIGVSLVAYQYLFVDHIAHYFGDTLYKKKINFHEYDIWISAIILAPIIEEALFRLPLTEKEKYNWILIVPTIIFSIVSFFVFKPFLIIALLLIGYSFFCIFYKSITIPKLYSTNRLLIVTFVSIAFSFMHIVLYLDGTLSLIQQILLVFLAYLPLSFALAYTRIRFGFKYAIVLHSFLNLSTIILNSIVY